MYGAVPFQVFGEVMRRKLDGSPLAYMQQRIFDPIGLEHGRWLPDRDGNPRMPSGAALTARDWAKLGELMRLGGECDGEQVIPRELLDQCLQPSDANPCYGLTWWLVRPATRSELPEGDQLSPLMAHMATIPEMPDDLWPAVATRSPRPRPSCRRPGAAEAPSLQNSDENGLALLALPLPTATVRMTAPEGTHTQSCLPPASDRC